MSNEGNQGTQAYPSTLTERGMGTAMARKATLAGTSVVSPGKGSGVKLTTSLKTASSSWSLLVLGKGWVLKD